MQQQRLGVLPAFLLLLPLAVFASESRAAESITLDPSWQQQNKYYDFVLAHDAQQTIFRVVLAHVNATRITTSWVYGDIVQQATYDRSTRVDVDDSGFYTFLWVNGDDIEDGSTTIGKRQATLVSTTPAYYLFVSGMREYYYSRTTGVLLSANDLATGTEILRTLEGTVLSAPEPDNDERERVYLSEEADEHVEATPEQASATNTLTLTCSDIVDGPLPEGGKACTDTFFVLGGFDIDNVSWGWPTLSSGYLNITLLDGGEMYAARQCYTDVPYVGYDPQNETTCDPPWRSTKGQHTGVTHTFRLYGSFNYCLNPRSDFDCDFSGAMNITGRVREP